MSTQKHNFSEMSLTSQDVERSRSQYGDNRLSPPHRPSIFKLYLEKFNDPIIRILLFAAALSLIIGVIENDFVESIGIFFAIFLATGIGFYFEYDAAKRFDALNSLGQEESVTVIRNGKVTQIPSSEIVVDDIVLLEQGNEVPADGTLLEAVSLELNESSLTGELVVSKTTEEEHFDEEATYPSNVALRSTMVVSGHGVMRVTAVGDATEIGKVARQATKLTGKATPLNKQLTKLAGFINKIAFSVAILAFLVCTLHEFISHADLYFPLQTHWFEALRALLKFFMMAVTLIVMAVPEGLPMAVTLSLAMNMRRMLKTNNLVRKMHACETMGAITVICTDKTGTLTQNRMQIHELKTEKDISPDMMAEAIAVNTTAHLDENGGVGNPTECALLGWLKDNDIDYAPLREQPTIIDQLTFSTQWKYMGTLIQPTASESQGRILYVKGAPEIILTYCDLAEEARTKVQTLLLSYQKQAMRTLAFAYKEIGDTDSTDCRTLVEQKGLTFMGIAAINDPVREEVPAAVDQCLQAGIKLKIVTGDTSATAIEIARRIGLWKANDTDTHAITGPQFESLSDEEALKRIPDLKVMSRARPMDKQRLVELLQKQGEVVAVTGDGTNDAPALNHAQVGLSMGSGTSVAKEASDITLMDDSFRSIATAVMWGRSLYRNIQRFIVFQLTINFVALLVVLIGSLIGTDLPLTVTQMLWINIIMDTFAALALASIPPSAEVMQHKPRKTSDFIITKPMKTLIFSIGTAFLLVLLAVLVYFNRGNAITPQEQTAFFTLFVLLQFWNLFNAQTFGENVSAFRNLFRNKELLLVLAFIIVGQWLIVEFGGRVFRTVPLSLENWVVLLAATSLVLWVGEIIRGIKRLAAKRKKSSDHGI